MKLALIGLGRMGWPIGERLSRSHPDCDIVAFDAQAQVMQDWTERPHAKCGSSVGDTVKSAQVIVSSLPADEQLLEVADQVAATIDEGCVWIDHSTTSAQAARTVATQIEACRASFIDAPVSGGVEGARQGTLTVMAGGNAAALERTRSVLDSYAARITHLGESGAGQLAKMTNQICVIGLCQALAEGLDFATRSGLDTAKMVEVMLQGSSASWQMANRANQMLAGEYDFGFSTTLMRKDIGLVLEHARAMQAKLPATELVSDLLDEVDAMGGAQWDWCSLMERQRQS